MMLFFILTIVGVVAFIIKYYKNCHRHLYINFEQFNQYYCCPISSSIDGNDSFSLPSIDMFDKCNNNCKYHTESPSDSLSISEYIQEFLCRSNDYMSRPRPVCPFVLRSLKQQSTYFFIASNDEYNNKQELIKMVRRCRYDFLLKLKPTDGNKDNLVHKCLIILIRSLNISHSIIDEVQTELKPEFIIQHGLMFGEFHASSNSSASRNENFYPFRTRVPLLVMRYMVANDIIFLNQKQKYSVDIRLNMVKKYLNLYHLGLLYRSKANHLQTANEILEELNSEVTE